jgi:hypothetical protein
MKVLFTILLILLAGPAQATDFSFGNIDSVTSNSYNFSISEGWCRGSLFLCDTTGILDSLHFIIGGAAGSENVRFAIYAAWDSSQIDTTENLTSTGASDRTKVTAHFQNGATVYADSTYFVVAGDDAETGVYGVRSFLGGTSHIRIITFSTSAWTAFDPFPSPTIGTGAYYSWEAFGHTEAEASAVGGAQIF